ncbi:WAT1-related protein [Acorus gramineus]|uniref:WAT1-related protein n=1 Tax=Acorus gramineus TaxID=55184 RepID=A0AAV9A778_ACOGR|nr:WAT1-related protein [Acorus gramineus]
MKASSSIYSWAPQAAAMIVIQLLYGGLNILSKLTLDHGMSYIVFTAYRHALAALIPGPFAFALENMIYTSNNFRNNFLVRIARFFEKPSLKDFSPSYKNWD